MKHYGLAERLGRLIIDRNYAGKRLRGKYITPAEHAAITSEIQSKIDSIIVPLSEDDKFKVAVVTVQVQGLAGQTISL